MIKYLDDKTASYLLKITIKGIDYHYCHLELCNTLLTLADVVSSITINPYVTN